MSDNRVTVTIAGPSYLNTFDATDVQPGGWAAFARQLRTAIEHAQQLAAHQAQAHQTDAYLGQLAADDDDAIDTSRPHVRGCPRQLLASAECLCNPARTGLRRD